MTEPEVGQTYRLYHVRFGNAVVEVRDIQRDWIDVLIVSGTLRGINNFWEPGETKTVRASHCQFTEHESEN